MATIYDVSQKAGVSLATVSRVMNNNAKVSEKTKAKVHQAMAELGYRPNSIAQSLASNRSNSIGVVVSQLDGPFYGPMMRRIETALRQADKHAIIAVGHSDATQEQEAIDFLLSRGCDALIIEAEALADAVLIELSKQDRPIVLINRYIAEIAERCTYLDNVLGGFLATEFALKQGHRQLAFICGPQYKHDAQERVVGYQQALAAYDLSWQQMLHIEGDYREESGYQQMQRLLERKPQQEFSCVICANDQMASGAIAACLEAGLKVPEQISFVGFDNIPFPRYISPTLTTITNPIESMGEAAAIWILKQTYQQQKDTAITQFKPQLVERGSVAPLKVNAPCANCTKTKTNSIARR